MEEQIVQLVQDLGIYTVLIVVFLYIGLKYIPKFLDLKLKRTEEKDYMLDSFKTVIENNSQVIANNSEVIRLNSDTIKTYTSNSDKLGNKIDNLIKEVQETNKNVEILKEIGGK